MNELFECGQQYTISVIVPIYNVEEYLTEAIESVIGQYYDFAKVQLILINDGSPDNSKAVCERYCKSYPDNIFYYEKENGGVSSARNLGISKVKGKYTVFLDGDDYWDPDSFKEIERFFKSHKDVNVCSCRIEHAGDFTGRKHPLDYKFDDGERVVDLMEEPDIISSTIGNVVFRSSCISDTRFDESFSVGEDSLFVNSVLLNDPHIGILPTAVMNYRRNFTFDSGSSSAPKKKEWYLDIPRKYYLGLCEKSVSASGSVLQFIQYVILYDLRWRHYNEDMMSVLDDREKQEHISIMHDVMSKLDIECIKKAEGLDQYTKLYFYNLKFGKEIIRDLPLNRGRFYFEDKVIFSLLAKSIVNIKTMYIDNDILIMDGITKLSAAKRPYTLYFKDNKGNIYPVSSVRYQKDDLKGYIGEQIVEAEQFHVEIPVAPGIKIKCCADICDSTLKLRPRFDGYIGLNNKYDSGFCVKNGYIVKKLNNRICIYENNSKTRLASSLRFSRDMIRKNGLLWIKKRIDFERGQYYINDCKLKDRVAFVSVRSDGELSGNMKYVYDMLDLPKAYCSKLNMYKDPEYSKKATELVYSSKVVVTDDYLYLFRNNSKKKGQYYVQLWHATGTGKYFGQDATSLFPPTDALYHRQYDLVTVSSESIKQTYASAFGIDVSIVKATGVARTDEFFDKDHIEKTTAEIYASYPELKGKQIILYTPTFRDIPGVPRSHFAPELDFERLSEELKSDQLFVIAPHPLMTDPILDKPYDNIMVIRDFSSNNLMFVSDIMITDYSSTMFEFALLKKPMAFFCYDYDEYDRDFYIDFDTELPGPVLKAQEDLISFLKQDDHKMSYNYDSFFDKYLGACDGHSTERIVEEIKKLYYRDL